MPPPACWLLEVCHQQAGGPASRNGTVAGGAGFFPETASGSRSASSISGSRMMPIRQAGATTATTAIARGLAWASETVSTMITRVKMANFRLEERLRA